MKSTTARISGSDVGYGPGAELLEFLAPACREVAVEVEPLAGPLDLHREAVEAVVAAFRHDTIVGAADFGRIAPHHQPRLLADALSRVPFGSAMRICRMRPSPSMSSTVRPSDVLLVQRIGARARADPFRLVGERPFGAVGIDPRTDVERARVERARDVGIVAVLRDERMQEVERRGRRGHFGRMDVAVDPEGGLFAGRAGCAVRDGQYPDVAAFVALADRLDRDEARMLARERVQQVGELGVAMETVEGDLRHVGVPVKVRGADGDGVEHLPWHSAWRVASYVNARRELAKAGELPYI